MKKTNSSAWLAQLKKYLLSPMALGVVITLIFVGFANTYYSVRSQNRIDTNDGRLSTFVFRIIESLDFILVDGRFLIRGEQKSSAPVALLTIDDASVEEVGRWPWSRSIQAQLLQRMMDMEAAAVGIDVVWPEPEIDPRVASLVELSQKGLLTPELKEYFDRLGNALYPDEALAEVIKKYPDRIVLGAYPERRVFNASEPYADYCINEAFKRDNADLLIKVENISFLVEDKTDVFESVQFDQLFNPIFDDIERIQTAELLATLFNNKTVEELNPIERRQLAIELNNRRMNYCNTWLKGEDPYGPMSERFFASLEGIPLFEGKSPTERIELFSRHSLIYPMPQNLAWTVSYPTIQQHGTFTGSFDAHQDNDGKIRSNPLFYRTGNRVGNSFVPSLALQTYLAKMMSESKRAKVEIDVDPRNPGQKIIKAFNIVNFEEEDRKVFEIPVDSTGRLKINYAGGTAQFPYVPAKEILSDSPTMTIEERVFDPELNRWKLTNRVVDKKEFIKGRSFIYGATSTGVYDLRVTPFEKNFPGPETHLTVLANLLEQNFLRVDRNEQSKMLWALLIIGLLMSLIVATSGALLGAAVLVAAEGGLLVLDQFMLRNGQVATMILPVLLVAAVYFALTIYKYFTEELGKKHLRTTFAKYVSPSVVNEILKSPENIELGGKKQHMSVLFSDVRGFTTISEKLEPQVLSDVLNAYLTPMTQIVFDCKGTLDKYMGDAIMAFFGAPIAFPDHAAWACRCALRSLDKLKEIQLDFAKRGLPHIDIGIGINTSDMSVGNMGSDTVRSYTVMGDGVNLGSRLEGITKEYGVRIVISEFTQKELGDQFTVRPLDLVRVKGKLKPVKIYELLAEGPVPNELQAFLAHYNKGIDLYLKKAFAEAKVEFETALAQRASDSPTELYIERCDEYLNTPPPEDWDGVHIMKTK